jgi:hypothetical protein
MGCIVIDRLRIWRSGVRSRGYDRLCRKPQLAREMGA